MAQIRPMKPTGVDSISMKNIAFFAIAVVALFFIYDYHEILPKRPQSVHQWRQCDGASIALSYANNGLNPFRPANHNQLSKDGKVVAEFPIVYYIDGVLIRIFGHSDEVIRGVNILLFFFGLFYLFRISLLITRNTLLALFPVVLAFSLPVLTFYAASSLPNIPAFSFMIAGLYYCIVFYRDRKIPVLVSAVIFCSIAGMIKSTTLLPFMAFLGAVLYGGLKKNQLHIQWKHWLILGLPILMTLGWILVARQYNAAYDAEEIFLMTIKPIWNLDREFIDKTSERIMKIWMLDYTYIPMLLFLAACGLGFLVLPQKQTGALKAGMILLLAGSIAYLYLFFEQFYHHDYYVIELYFLVLASALALLYLLKDDRLPVKGRQGIYILVAVITVLNIRYTDREMHARYTIDNQYNNYNDVFFDVTPKLRDAGIQRDDKVLVVNDRSPNISLYLMNQIGRTRFPEGLDSTIVAGIMEEDIQYIICKPHDLEERPYIRPYLKELLIEHKTLLVYSTQSPTNQKKH